MIAVQKEKLPKYRETQLWEKLPISYKYNWHWWVFKFRTGLEILENLVSFFAFFPFSSFCSTPILCFLFHLSYNIPSSINTCVLSCFSPVQIFVTLWTVAHQVPLPMGFPRQEYWSGLPFPSPGDLPNPGIEPSSLMSPALAGSFFYG